jgi:hypothetical protein
MRPMQSLRYTTEMHDDFKPHSVAGAPQNVLDAIKADVSSHKVMLYMKVRRSPVLPVSCTLLALQLFRLRLSGCVSFSAQGSVGLNFDHQFLDCDASLNKCQAFSQLSGL